jgi:hypothetical protein
MEDDSSWKLGAVARRALPNNLIHPLSVQDHKNEGSGDLLFQSPMHAGARGGETMAAAWQQKEAKTMLARLDAYCHG